MELDDFSNRKNKMDLCMVFRERRNMAQRESTQESGKGIMVSSLFKAPKQKSH